MEASNPSSTFSCLSILSIVAERLANAIKLGNPPRNGAHMNRKERERLIANRAMAVSVVLATLVRRTLRHLAHLDAP